MNQILSTSIDNNKYNNNDTRKIIVIFCIAIIIVALGIIVLKIYGMNQNKNNYKPPEIQIGESENNQVKIYSFCEDGINYIIYKWNESDENRINLNGIDTFERIIDIPYNKNNVLNVEVVSSHNVKSQTSKNFTVEVDEEKPVIDSINVVGSMLNLEALDNEGLDYIEYEWENEEPNKIYADENNNKTLNTQINIKRGTHKLKISVVDIHGNQETISRVVTGVNEPEIQVIKYGSVINIKATHDMGIKQISVLINSKLYVFNENSPEFANNTTQEVEYPLVEGENIVKIIVHSNEKLSEDEDDSLSNFASKSYVGKCTYNP